MIDETFLTSHSAQFPDFWNRQVGDSEFELEYPAFGYTVHLNTNEPVVLEGAELSAARYARARELAGAPQIQLHVRVVATLPDTAVPMDLPSRLQTIGVGDYMFQAATPWVQWFTDLKARTTYALLSPALAAHRWELSRNMLDRAVLNILLREGVGQLHATSLVRDDCVVLFIAPHGTGKSTTAFHLLNSGFRLMGDGLLFVREHAVNGEAGIEQFELMGYPVGEAKLTAEAQLMFPEWNGEGEEFTWHKVHKRIVNLRTLAPNKMIETSVMPKRVILCLAERNGQPLTTAERLAPEVTLERLLPDTIFWDESEAMIASLRVLKRLIEHAACYRLTLGADRQQLIETIVNLQWERDV